MCHNNNLIVINTNNLVIEIFIYKELKNIFHPKIVTHLISEPSDALLYLDLTVLIHVTVDHNEILRSL